MSNERPSVYLQEKCSTLEAALDFFSQGSAHFSLNEKKLTFLAQIDFWEWELETVIYSFDNFKERSAAWDSIRTIRDRLAKQGIIVRENVISQAESKRGWNQHLRSTVVEPWVDLNRLIDKWNGLLESCEKKLMDGSVNPEWCPNVLTDLSKYKKKRREIS